MVTSQNICAGLRALGLETGDVVMMHSSLSALGPVDGGAETVVEALLEVIGDSGTLLVPAFRDSVWGDLADFSNTDCDCTSADGLCASEQPGFQGIIPELIRRWPGALRSCHPTHSWVAVGPAARALLIGHRKTPATCGRYNPFEHLIELDGKLLILGVQVNTITLWHYYEELLDVPYLGHFWPQQRHLNNCVGGKRIQYEYPGIMQEVCKASGILKTGAVGKGTSGLMRVRDFDSFMATIFADDPNCMVLRPPTRDCGDLAQDALCKGAAMLRAWAEGPAPPPESLGVALSASSAPGPGDTVREDCPAYAGYHQAGDESVPVCRANGCHPDYFRNGGIFAANGPTTCDACSWHRKYPQG